jgi:hypothetical protein
VHGRKNGKRKFHVRKLTVARIRIRDTRNSTRIVPGSRGGFVISLRGAVAVCGKGVPRRGSWDFLYELFFAFSLGFTELYRRSHSRRRTVRITFAKQTIVRYIDFVRFGSVGQMPAVSLCARGYRAVYDRYWTVTSKGVWSKRHF